MGAAFFQLTLTAQGGNDFSSDLKTLFYGDSTQWISWQHLLKIIET